MPLNHSPYLMVCSCDWLSPGWSNSWVFVSGPERLVTLSSCVIGTHLKQSCKVRSCWFLEVFSLVSKLYVTSQAKWREILTGFPDIFGKKNVNYRCVSIHYHYANITSWFMKTHGRADCKRRGWQFKECLSNLKQCNKLFFVYSV